MQPRVWESRSPERGKTAANAASYIESNRTDFLSRCSGIPLFASSTSQVAPRVVPLSLLLFPPAFVFLSFLHYITRPQSDFLFDAYYCSVGTEQKGHSQYMGCSFCISVKSFPGRSTHRSNLVALRQMRQRSPVPVGKHFSKP